MRTPRRAIKLRPGFGEVFRKGPSDGIILDEFSQGRECLADMQDTLSACDLTLRDVQRIKDAFRAILVGMYHPRIEYPEKVRLLASRAVAHS